MRCSNRPGTPARIRASLLLFFVVVDAASLALFALRGLLGTGTVLLGLALTVFAGPLYDYVDRAAAGLRGGVYLEAVLSGVVQ